MKYDRGHLTHSIMATTASPRAADPKMVESPVSMVHASFTYARNIPTLRRLLTERIGRTLNVFLLALELAVT